MHIDEQLLHPGEKIDDLQRSGLRIIQDPARFCFGMDAVLLTGFIQEGIGGRSVAREELLDLGTGTGIIPLLMSAKSDCNFLTGLEIQPDSAEMASRSVKLNGLEDRVRILQGDIKEADALFAPASFGIVTCNPPYMIGGHGLKNPDAPKAIARHEVLCTLDDVVRSATLMCKPSGRFYMVHRPERLVDIFSLMRKNKLEPKILRMVYSNFKREPKLILIKGIKNSKSFLKIEKNLYIYNQDGKYTDDILKIYKKI